MNPLTEAEQAATHAATNDKPPAPEAKVLRRKSPGMTRKGFAQLLKRAFTPQDSKPDSDVTIRRR
jgi:hypothetical protein